MTNFEKYKENLNIDNLIELVTKHFCNCTHCPLYCSTNCAFNTDDVCEDALLKYFSEEVNVND